MGSYRSRSLHHEIDDDDDSIDEDEDDEPNNVFEEPLLEDYNNGDVRLLL
jgi:hypothetical protein